MRRKSEIKGKDTDVMSLNRIWVHKQISELWFDSNDRHTANTIDKTIEFLEKAKKTAWQGGYIDVVVEPATTESNEFETDHACLDVSGWRMEDEGVENKDCEGNDDTTPIFSKLLTKTEFRVIINRLTALIKEADNYDKIVRWDGSDNGEFHKTAYKRLKDVVLRKSYKE